MSHLIRFIEGVRKTLTSDEWVFFNARYINRASVADAAAETPSFSGDANAMHQSVLRKLRGQGCAL